MALILGAVFTATAQDTNTWTIGDVDYRTTTILTTEPLPELFTSYRYKDKSFISYYVGRNDTKGIFLVEIDYYDYFPHGALTISLADGTSIKCFERDKFKYQGKCYRVYYLTLSETKRLMYNDIRQFTCGIGEYVQFQPGSYQMINDKGRWSIKPSAYSAHYIREAIQTWYPRFK